MDSSNSSLLFIIVEKNIAIVMWFFYSTYFYVDPADRSQLTAG